MFWVFRLLRRRLMLFFLLCLLALSPISISADAFKANQPSLSTDGASLDSKEHQGFNLNIEKVLGLEEQQLGLQKLEDSSYQEALQELAVQFYAILNREETKQIIRQFLDLFIGIMEMMKSWLS